MKRNDLQEVANISSTHVDNLGKGKNISTDILVRTCESLDCAIMDIMELKEIDPKYSHSFATLRKGIQFL